MGENKNTIRVPFGILNPPDPMDAEYMDTLQQWGDLPNIVPVPDAANLLASLCKQNYAAILKVLESAILGGEIEYWGLSQDGDWKKGMIRVFFSVARKPKIRPPTETQVGQVQYALENGGKLHVEAMGVNPGDMVALLKKRGRKVPDALLGLHHDEDLSEPAAKITPLSRTEAQDLAILNALSGLNVDPLKMPPSKPGRPGVKAMLWEKLEADHKVFSSKSVFDAAWKRLKKAD